MYHLCIFSMLVNIHHRHYITLYLNTAQNMQTNLHRLENRFTENIALSKMIHELVIHGKERNLIKARR